MQQLPLPDLETVIASRKRSADEPSRAEHRAAAPTEPIAAGLVLSPVKPAPLAPKVDTIGLGVSLATGLTLGICGYYAHELIDPEIDASLLPDIPVSDEGARFGADRSDRSDTEVLGVATPEFLPSLGREIRQWRSDLDRFVRALRTRPPRREAQPLPANPAVENLLDRLSGLVPEASTDPLGELHMYRARTQAMSGQFAAALIELHQIPSDSPSYALAQEKIAEYTQARDIRARVLLQTAFDLAAAGDFSGALSFLSEIPAEASVYATVAEKRIEYTEKLEVQAQTQLYRAELLAEDGRHADASALLRAIPRGTASYSDAKQRILEYHRIAIAADREAQPPIVAQRPVEPTAPEAQPQPSGPQAAVPAPAQPVAQPVVRTVPAPAPVAAPAPAPVAAPSPVAPAPVPAPAPIPAPAPVAPAPAPAPAPVVSAPSPPAPVAQAEPEAFSQDYLDRKRIESPPAAVPEAAPQAAVPETPQTTAPTPEVPAE
ncbi:MAG: hypothetical protein ACFB9N_16615 [Geitlerinemataceae cyanobacterium]